jgi:hypothetical protein
MCCWSTVDITEAGLEPALPGVLRTHEFCFDLFGIGTR